MVRFHLLEKCVIFESCIAGWQVISVGIERNVPIRSFATAIGQIYERFQGYWISGYYPSSLSILKPELRCLIGAESG